MQWKHSLFALAVIPLLSLAALADTSDDALEAVLQKLKAGDAAGAIADLDKLASLSPAQTLRARYYRAFAHKKLGMADLALSEVSAILPPAGDTAQRTAFAQLGGVYSEKAWSLLGAIYRSTSKFDKLQPIYENMMADFPTNPEWEFLRADALFDAGNLLGAATAYGQCATKYPAYSRAGDATFRKQEALRNAGRYQEAFDYLGSLPTTDPKWDIQIAVKSAELLAQFMRKDFATSTKLLEDIIAKYPGDAAVKDARCRLARNYLYDLPVELRDYAKARTMEEQIIKEFPDWNMIFEMRLDIANSYYFEKDYPKAIAGYKAILADYPDNYPTDNWHSHIRFMLGVAYLAKKDKDMALAAWQEVTVRYPTDAWADLAKQRIDGVIQKEQPR